MKIGTLFCNLFGHKFVIWSSNGNGTESLMRLTYCTRCGADKTS